MYSRSSFITLFLLFNLLLAPMILASNNENAPSLAVDNIDAGKVGAIEIKIFRSRRGASRGLGAGALAGGSAALAAKAG
ncbi:hypothetical protein ACQ4LE_010144 [Meloidogyne hapla]|uniref:Uncharacterized protein n=1 Tax=Meloidogyne hapla TaxID=6305 RepID=A0A1I8BBT2_MELHA